jgi:phosphatidate cytidylyltransferase
MLTRILTAVVALLLLVPLLIWGGTVGACALFALISGFCVFEMLSCCGLLKKWAISIPAIILSALTVLMPVISNLLDAIADYYFILPLVIVFSLIVAVVMHEKLDVERLLMFITLAIYITAGFSALSAMRIVCGLWAVAFVLSVSWATDTFAYFSGYLFGKRKLCPNISPKKTVEGAIGGTLFGTLAGVLVCYIANGEIWFGFLALPLSVISQFGDLAASVIKRRFGVKDYGKIFPGHGGVLDRFDSIIPVSVAAAFLLFFVR